MKTPTASEVLQHCEDNMNDLIRTQFVSLAKNAKLNLQRAIELEARYITVQEQAKANDEPNPFDTDQSRGDLKELIEAVSMADVEAKVEEKISRINRELTVYASLKQGVQSDNSVTAAHPKFFALADQNNAQEGFSLGKIVEQNIQGISSVHDEFHDPNKAFFYQSTVNMPLYWLSNVRGDMERYYKEKKEKNKKGAGYIPYHIDWNWETGAVTLPILDPVSIKAQKEQETKQRAIQMYLRAFYFGVLVEAEGVVSLLFRGRESKMGDNHLESWNAYTEMSSTRKEMIEAEIAEKWAVETSKSHLLEPVVERLERMQKETEGLHWDADEQGYTQLIQQLELEIEAIKDMIRTVKSHQT